MKIFEIEERLKDIETRQKRFEKLLARSMGNIPELMAPEHIDVVLRSLTKTMNSPQETISLIDYTPHQWTRLLLEENIPVLEAILPDKRHESIAQSEDEDATNVTPCKYIDMDVIPFALEKVDFLFIPSPYLADYALEFPAWLSRISQKVNKGIIFSVQFSNEDGDSQIRSILHKNGFVDVMLLNPSMAQEQSHSRYSSKEDFYWAEMTENNTSNDNGLKREPGKILINSLKSLPSVYLASRLPLKD